VNRTFNARLGIVQRVLPVYRAPFFDALAAACAGGMSLFAGQPRPDESIPSADRLHALRAAHYAPARNLHFGSASSSFYLCYQRGLIDWLNEWNPDALIIEANFRYLSSAAAISWMHLRGRPVLGWGLGAPRGRGPFAFVRNRFLRRFDALIAYSQRGAQQYADSGMAARRISIAPNAVVPAPGHPLPPRPDGFDPRPCVLFVGRLQARKRIPSLLGACAALPEQLRPRLVVVGDGPERKNLEALAASTYPAAEFLGALHGPALVPYFLAADLFVLPGTGGLAVQEAMSYGLPVIVARGDGTQDDLVRAANGWQIPPDDDAALAAALHNALSDVRRLRAMGAESYRIVAQEINLEKMVEVFVGALNGAILKQTPKTF